MATTAENITLIQMRVPNYSRAQILAVMSEIYEEIYAVETEQTLYLDTTTGMPPYIVTTDGTYTYNCPANCRRTASIFSTEMPRTYARTRPVGPQREYYFRTNGYYKIPITQSTDIKPDGTLATVTFYDNPGSTTTTYYHAYYIAVTPLSTEAVVLQIPDWTHRQLRRATIAMLRAEDYGETGSEESIIRDAARKIRAQLNRGAQGTMGMTPVPMEYQTYNNAYYEGRI